jgi:hypothetical protein
LCHVQDNHRKYGRAREATVVETQCGAKIRFAGANITMQQHFIFLKGHTQCGPNVLGLIFKKIKDT